MFRVIITSKPVKSVTLVDETLTRFVFYLWCRALETLGGEFARVCDNCVAEIDGAGDKNLQIRIEVCNATILTVAEKGVGSAFVEVECDDILVGKTPASTSSRNANPFWEDQTFQWEVPGLSADAIPVVTFSLWGKQRFKNKSRLLGQCYLPINLLQITSSDDDREPQLIGIHPVNGGEQLLATLAIKATMFSAHIVRTILSPLDFITGYVELITETKIPLVGAAVSDAYEQALLRTMGEFCLSEEELEALEEGESSFKSWLISEDFMSFCDMGVDSEERIKNEVPLPSLITAPGTHLLSFSSLVSYLSYPLLSFISLFSFPRLSSLFYALSALFCLVYPRRQHVHRDCGHRNSKSYPFKEKQTSVQLPPFERGCGDQRSSVQGRDVSCCSFH